MKFALLFLLVFAQEESRYTGKADHPLRLRIQSRGVMKVSSGETIDAESDTSLEYTLKRVESRVGIVFDRVAARVKQDGSGEVRYEQSADRYVYEQGEKKLEFTRETAPPAMRKEMAETYGKVLCTYEVDATGRETGRKMSAGEGAKGLIDTGQVENARLFHVSYPDDRKEWEAPAKISLGSKSFVKGNLKLVKQESGKVKVTGVLETIEQGKSDFKFDSVRYEVSGEQTWDATTLEWSSASWTIAFKSKMGEGETRATLTGKMTITLEARK